jgi:hypothetical protein
MTGLREPVTRAANCPTPCPTPWCQIHSRARCRSEPVEVVYACGGLDLAFAVGLEQWAGRTLGRREVTANLLLPDRVLMLPQEPAVELGRAWAALLAAAGWATAGSVNQRTPGSC